VISLADLRQSGEHDCGLVAVQVVLRHLRRRPKPHQFGILNCNSIDGTDPRAIEAFFRSIGCHVLAGSMAWTDLEQFTTIGRPVICLTTPAHGIGHYVVVAGVQASTVHYQCSTEGPCRSGKRTWMRSWHEVDRLGAIYHQWGICVWR
jgi:ABC-type bacteriocin/lantibiotic exporter with double-glycine peptidase domain